MGMPPYFGMEQYGMPLGEHAARYANLLAAAGVAPPAASAEMGAGDQGGAQPMLDRLSRVAAGSIEGLAMWGAESIDDVARMEAADAASGVD